MNTMVSMKANKSAIFMTLTVIFALAILDQEAKATLGQIIRSERNINSINSIFDTRTILGFNQSNGVSLRYELKVTVK